MTRRIYIISIIISIIYTSVSGRERLKTSYSLQHGYKNTSQGSRWGDRRVKPSSRGLMCGTNEDAEDLTGQRAPVASSR